MNFIIDTAEQTLTLQDGRVLDLYGKDAFEHISKLWLTTSWNQKYSYTFTWLGRPIIQHPEDSLRLQEVIYFLKPDVIIETGVAHGGSLVFSASLLKAMGQQGRVIGIDIEIRPHNRTAIEAHELAHLITLIEGNSVTAETVNEVAAYVKPDDVVMVLLDSNHSYTHVMAELEAYHRFVSIGSYIVATDGIMREVAHMPRGKSNWARDNPAQAAEDFVKHNPQFILEVPAWRFNESELDHPITAWPSAWLKRIT